MEIRPDEITKNLLAISTETGETADWIMGYLVIPLPAPLDVRPRAIHYSTIWLLSSLVVLGLIPMRAFLYRIIGSDYLALAGSMPDDSFYYLLPAWRFMLTSPNVSWAR